jgi:hypothetical protein
MKKERDYIQDITEIRSMMERSAKFFFLSGWEGIFAGIYALSGTFIAYKIFNFNPDKIVYTASPLFPNVFVLALIVLILAISTAVILSYRKAVKKGEKAWNPTSQRLLTNMAVPLAAGGILIIALVLKNLVGLILPATLLFYGLALYNASKFTIDEVKYLGLIEIGLGLINFFFIEFGLLFWAVGFGVVHIVYGIYMYFRYER